MFGASPSDSEHSATTYARIFSTCLTVLYVELLLIRLISTEISIFAYLQNSILVICFLGLGMGLYRGKEGPNVTKAILPLSILMLLAIVPMFQQVLAAVSRILSLFHDFQVWDLAELHVTKGWARALFVPFAASILFLVASICWSVMVPLGARLGSLLDEAPSPLLAYSWDIAGSAAGILLFTLLSFLSLSPVFWILGLFPLVLLWPDARSLKALWPLLVTCGLAVFLHLSERNTTTVWSPYQKLQASPTATAEEWIISTNNSGFQRIMDNRPQRGKDPALHQYNIPSQLAGSPSRALVVGAGTGNDLAGVLRHSSSLVTAIEIDPQLIRLGRKLHPEHPYDDPRVTFVVDDARAAFEKLPSGTFDLIIFGLLDSHTTPNLSNARLDNFVYTVESLRAAKRLLSEKGVLVLIFNPQREYIAARLNNTLEAVFGTRPLAFRCDTSAWGWGGTVFVSGNADTVAASLARLPELKSFIETNEVRIPRSEIAPTTDRWPYLYIEAPSIPTLFYFLGFMLVLLWCVSSARQFGTIHFPGLRSSEEWTFFLLGVGFSCAQVFAVNNAAILFGSTWLVNSSVIFGVLVLILCANFLTARRLKISSVAVASILFLVCVGLTFLPMRLFLGLSFYEKFLGGSLLSGLPMLFSGILFARNFQGARDRGQALGANLLGAMVGGVMQLATFRFGIPSLMVIAAISYSAVGILSAVYSGGGAIACSDRPPG